MDRHPWSGIAHHLTNLFPLPGFIAMNRAFGASGFSVLEGALFHPLQCIVKQGLTFRAQGLPVPVMPAAINPQHDLDGMPFTFQTIILLGHHTRLG